MFLWVLWALTRPQNPQKHLYNLGGGRGKKMTFETLGTIRSYTLRLRRNSSLCTCFVCFACAKHTKHVLQFGGRRRRPACTGILPLQFESPWIENGKRDIPRLFTVYI